MADVVFIIGAGCSVHAGAPIMANFLDRARTLFANREVEDRRAEFETVFKALSALQLVHSKANLDLYNIESVFSALDVARTLRKLPGFDPEQIDGVLSALQWMIVRTLEQSISIQSYRGMMTGTKGYRKFGELIRDLGNRTPPLSAAVITFNYDIALDISLADLRIPVAYSLDSIFDPGVPLLKLHGSLNWARDKIKKKVLAMGMGPYRHSQRTSYYSGDPEDTFGSVPVSNHLLAAMKTEGEDVDEIPVIVPPTWSKGEHHREIGHVWARAAKELTGASVVCVLGYSLPDTDQFFRLLFGLGSAGGTLLDRIVVADPNITVVEQRFRDMLGSAALSRLSPLQQEFGAAINSIRTFLQVPSGS